MTVNPTELPGAHEAVRRAFTLIELMVVVVVVSLLAGLVGPRILKFSRRLEFDGTVQHLAGLIRQSREASLSSCEKRIDGVPVQVRHGFRLVPVDEWDEPSSMVFRRVTEQEREEARAILEVTAYGISEEVWNTVGGDGSYFVFSDTNKIAVSPESSLAEGDIILFDVRGMPGLTDGRPCSESACLVLVHDEFTGSHDKRISVDCQTGRITVEESGGSETGQ